MLPNIKLKQLTSILITLFFAISCKNDVKNISIEDDLIAQDSLELIVKNNSIDSIIISEYDMSDIDKKDIIEFKENLAHIEEEFGSQWDFCRCVIKGDSINGAFMDEHISDSQFVVLEKRLDQIDEKCQAFRVQNPNITPDERAAHKEKVRLCLERN